MGNIYTHIYLDHECMYAYIHIYLFHILNLLILHFLKAFSPNVLTWLITFFSFKTQGTYLPGGYQRPLL